MIKRKKEKKYQTEFEAIALSTSRIKLEQFEHQFKLILAYPLKREFYSKEEFKKKIALFNKAVLEVEQYTILYRINRVEIGTIDQYYLIRFSGTTSSVYLENKVDEVVGLLISQLEGFFNAVQSREFRPLYFELDGQVLIQPKVDELAIPKTYSLQKNFWEFTNNTRIWDDYWESYAICDLVDLVSNVAFTNGDLEIGFDGDGCCDSGGDGCFEAATTGCGDGQGVGCSFF